MNLSRTLNVQLRLRRLLRASGPWKMDEHNLDTYIYIYIYIYMYIYIYIIYTHQNGRRWAKTGRDNMTKCDEHVWRPRHLEMNSPGWGTSSLLMRAKSALRRLHVDLFTKIWTHRVTFFFAVFLGCLMII